MESNDFQIFKDKELKIPAGDPIDLGKVKAGKTKKFTFYVYNSSVNPHDELKFSVNNEDVSVVSSPENMKEKSTAIFILKWEPKLDVRQGLKAIINIESFEVIG